jgi:type IV secretory pathway VirB4 component
MHGRQTTAQLQALFPFVAPRNLGSTGAYIGPDLLGRPFYFDPIAFYGSPGLNLNDPNLLILGQIGKGKSALVKCLARRLNVFGYSTVYLDPKGETAPLAAAFGVQSLRPAPGGELCLNPFDAPGADANQSDLLLQSVLAVMLERPLTMAERRALTEATVLLRRKSAVPTLSALEQRIDAGDDRVRELSLALWNYLHGPALGLFDGRTSSWVDLDAPLIALDLSTLLHTLAGEQLRTVTLALAAAWLFAAPSRRQGRRLFVVDEAWYLLRDRATAQWLQQQWKLARGLGIANVAVLHRLSDLEAAASGIEIARGLLADTQTRVIFAQPASELPLLEQWLGLSHQEADCVLGLPRGWALWKVADRSFVVQLDLQRSELELVDTDHHLRPAAQPNPALAKTNAAVARVGGAAERSGKPAAHRVFQSAIADRKASPPRSHPSFRVLSGGRSGRPQPPAGTT